LVDPFGRTILDTAYNATNKFVSSTGCGFSIVPNPNGNSDNWRASSNIDGSPGSDDPEPVPVNSVIISDVSANAHRIVLRNPTASEVDISGWFLSDKFSKFSQVVIPNGVKIAPQGTYVIARDQLGKKLKISAKKGGKFYLFSTGVKSKKQTCVAALISSFVLAPSNGRPNIDIVQLAQAEEGNLLMVDSPLQPDPFSSFQGVNAVIGAGTVLAILVIVNIILAVLLFQKKRSMWKLPNYIF